MKLSSFSHDVFEAGISNWVSSYKGRKRKKPQPTMNVEPQWVVSRV